MYKENKFYAFLLFLIWPVLSVWFAFKNYRSPWAKNIIWIFVSFYAFTMVISHTGMDANRYRDKFIEMANTDGIGLEALKLYNEGEEINLDILQPFLSVAVSRFTDNYKVLFAFYGLIFGYFFSRNLWILIDKLEHPLTSISIFLLIVFSLINPIWNINGFRMWTAAQIFVYGGLVYFLEGKRKGIILAMLSILVHFSFMIPIAIFIIYFILGNRTTIYFYLFIISLFVSELDLGMVKNNLAFAPDIFENKIDAYTNEDYREKKENIYNSRNWYVKYYHHARNYAIYLYIIVLYWKGRHDIKNYNNIYNLFGFSLLFLGIANIISSVPSLGRFTSVALSFTLAIIILGLDVVKKNKPIINTIKLTIPALLLFIIVSIRIGFYTIGLTTILGNPIIAYLMDGDLALDNIIK